MNKLLFFSFISLFSLFGMQEDSFIAKLKNARHLYPVSAGLLTSVGVYGLSKTNIPLLKNIKILSSIKKFLFCSGSGLAVGGLFLIFNNKANKKNIKIEEEKIEETNAGLINSPKDFDFWFTNKDAVNYLAHRIKIKNENIEKEEKEEKEQSELVLYEEHPVLNKYIEDIKSGIYERYWNKELELKEIKEKEKKIKEKQVSNFLSSCDIEQCKEYKVRIFNKYILFEDLVEFINYVNRQKLLYFLAAKSTIAHNLQGELIYEKLWEKAEAGKLAAFLAFGYYVDTCGKFLYLEPDKLMTFLENAVYYMYLTDMGNFCSEEDYYYKEVTEVFKKYCRLKITNVEFKETQFDKIKQHPTQITVGKISEEEGSLKE